MTAAMNTAPPSLAPAGQGMDRATTARRPPDAPLDSATLLQGGKAVTIHHNGELYRLQATRQGKLILTK
ncbi:MAG: hemin uptake protein HemP [Burkholderiales bacterium]|nr:hemin uptake protein HemP [Burkholderiales bacterium]